MRFETIHTYGFPEAQHQKLIDALPDRNIRMLTDKAQLAEAIEEIEVILVFRPPRGLWTGARRLKLIQTVGAGVDSVLPAPDLPPQVAVTNARGIHSDQMAEHAVLMMLAFAKKLPQAMANQREHLWQFYASDTLAGRMCVVVGMGTIGQEVARRAKQFKMTVIGIQRQPKQFEYADEVLPTDQLSAALQRADYAVVILPLTDTTRHLLDAECLAALPSAAVLVNMARGGIVDEAALAQMLRDGRLKGVALDVFADEPLPESSPLWAVPNLIITPHIAGLVPDYLERVLEIFTDNIQRLESGRPLVNLVDRQRGY
jgi:D-2-hydroxyacid dehydrogenase (NADP+)